MERYDHVMDGHAQRLDPVASHIISHMRFQLQHSIYVGAKFIIHALCLQLVLNWAYLSPESGDVLAHQVNRALRVTPVCQPTESSAMALVDSTSASRYKCQVLIVAFLASHILLGRLIYSIMAFVGTTWISSQALKSKQQ